MIVIEIIQYGLGTLITILLGYQLIRGISALKKEKRISFKSTQNRHFAMVLPPPENEQMISKSLYSLFGLVYPKNLYDVIVIDAGITEEAANKAREMGAIVLKKNEPAGPGPGREMHWAFEQILKGDKTYDAVSVIESGSLVSGNYLDVMNYYLDQGSKVIQGSNLILPQAGFQENEVKRFRFLYNNIVRPLDRKVLGFNLGLQGNGVCFATRILRQNPWIPDSLPEDAGFGIKLQLKGIDIDFAREAILLTEMPEKPVRGQFVREYWSLRRFPLIKRYAPRLIAAAFRDKSLSYVRCFLDLITPSLINTFVAAVMTGALNMFMWAVAGWPLSFLWIWMLVAVLALANISVESYAINTYHQSYKSML